MENRVRVLMIEDDPDYAMLLTAFVNEACGDAVRYLLENAVSLQAGLGLLARQEYDIVLLDLMLPDSRGLETLDKLRAKAPSLPIVVLTNFEQDEAGLEAIARGAQDFLSKSNLDAGRLKHAIGFALARDRMFRQMETLVEGLPDGMVIVDRGGMVRYANAAALKLFGKRWEQFVGCAFEHPLTANRPVELRLAGLSGEEVSAELRAAEIEWKGYPAWVATLRDVSELKKLEKVRAEIRERRRTDQLKDQLLSTVAHELRSPLSVVKAVVGSLRDHLAGPLSPDQDELVAVGDRNVNRLTRLLNNFLDLTRLESRRARVCRQLIDPLALLKEICGGAKLANRGRPITFEFEFPESLPDIHADGDMIAQVIGNLLDNAARFARARIVVAAAARPDGVEVSVADDGCGIPPERMADVFDKFVQLDRPKGGEGYKGTGLGLAISREIVALHGGRIWVDRSPCGGARFRFTLPPSPPSAAAPREEGSHERAQA